MVNDSVRQIVLEAVAQAAGQGSLLLLGVAGQTLGTTEIRDTVIQNGRITLLLPDLKIQQAGRAISWSLRDRTGRELFHGSTTDLGWDAPVVEVEDIMEFTDLEISLP